MLQERLSQDAINDRFAAIVYDTTGEVLDVD